MSPGGAAGAQAQGEANPAVLMVVWVKGSTVDIYKMCSGSQVGIAEPLDACVVSTHGVAQGDAVNC